MTGVALHAEALTFAYPRSEAILRDLQVTVPYGRMVALTGPSGRGKSTLLYVLGLLVSPSSGDVRVDGRSTARLGDAQRSLLRAQAMGFVFQDAALDATRTVLDNVIEASLYRDERRSEAVARARALLVRFGVEPRAEARPGQVSGGQASRIALARALLGRPRIVLADEPTGNLDDASGAVVLSALREVADGGAAVVVATHDATVRDGCDDVVEL